MNYLLIALKIIVGLSILNVWLVQPRKSTKWRGGNASTIKEEFIVYGLPQFSVYIVGFFKVSLSLLLLASIYFIQLTEIAAYGLSLFLLGSILMHLKIKDPLLKSFPAALFLMLLIFILILH